MKLFVPGRICLFGEHSDWAGGYRRTNGKLEKGYTLITGTNQGLYAEVKPHPSKLIFHTTMNDGTRRPPFVADMNLNALLTEAESGSFFSYIAGTAYQIVTNYRVRGLEIDNYRTDLPMKKGLSSSAALCVLVARSFNRLYDLKMTTRGEMEAAYMGEITTPSRCGRMDQGCAYGQQPVLMTYDGDKLDVEEKSVSNSLHYVIVDLCAEKDTRKILNSLNHCYPFADSKLQEDVQHGLGTVNAQIVSRSLEAFESGNGELIGQLMSQAQAEFDRLVAPACPAELSAPVLHKVLAHPPLKPYIYGGKGVGSQGDGSAQLLARDKASQEKAIEILARDFSMPCLKLTISPNQKIRKALIPAAGFGTRLFPATKAVKKELFPIIDTDGTAKPALMLMLQDIIDAGINDIGVIIQPEDRELFENLFCSPPTIENFNKLTPESQKVSDAILRMGEKLHFIDQNAQDGFGHAVYCAKEWIGNEPFLLLLGDYIYASHSDRSCIRQLLDAYEEAGKSVVGLAPQRKDQLHLRGCVSGQWKEKHRYLEIDAFVEKPDPAYAEAYLAVEGIPEGHYLCLFGLYVLEPSVLPYIEESISHGLREKGEFQLTTCLDRLCKNEGAVGCMVDGRSLDIGTPQLYRSAVLDTGPARPMF